MNTTTSTATPVTLLGLGAMGAALARTWLAAGHPLTVWNRNPARADSLADAGAIVAASAAEAVAASPLVVVCLLDDASVGDVLAGADLTGKAVVNLTTGTPAQARERAAWVAERGGTLLDGGIMAVPPMIGVPGSGAYVFYSGPADVFEAHRDTLAVPADATYVGTDPGFAALYDVALLSAMYGMLGGITHAFALVRDADVPPREFADLLVRFLTAMAGSAHRTAEHLHTGVPAQVVSGLAMQVAGSGTLLRTADEQGVDSELVRPYLRLMERAVADGLADGDLKGFIGLLAEEGS